MAVTGTGTEQDPYIVHDYIEFISLSNTLNSTAYIQFFDNEHPNQVINCNTYGSEFKWHNFKPAWPSGNGKIYINLNGCTIKNFMIADGEAMFSGIYNGVQQYAMSVVVSNGSIRNVFMGSATSKFCDDYVEFKDVSLSVNFSGATVTPFNGDGNLNVDNCSMYLVGSTLQDAIIKKAVLTDTDIELHIANQNGKAIFRGDDTSDNYCTLQDCRIQGKISGTPISHTENGHYSVFGCATPYSGGDYGKICKLINCVIDVDLTDSFSNWYGAVYWIYKATGATDLNTNVLCNSHYPSAGQQSGYSYPSDWNYMPHEGNNGHNIRNGDWLNSQGFTVVEVVGS